MLEKIYNAITGGSDNHGYHHIIYTDVKLKDIVSDIIEVNTNDNLILYIDDFGLFENPYIDDKISKSLCSDYLNLVIFERALKQAKEVDISKIESILDNTYQASNLDELLELIKRSKSYILKMYYKKELAWENLKDLPVNIMEFDMERLPKACNVKRITVVFDNQHDLCNDSKVAVNDFIGSRITKYLTCILSTRKEKWIGLVTSNHQYIQEGHDYLVVEDEENKVYKKERYYGKQSNN